MLIKMSIPSCKIQRILEQLIPQSEMSNMVSKHSATLLSGGKMMCLGHNHLRSCNANKLILSCHAEMHVLNNYFNMNNAYGLRSFMNDSHYTMMGRKKKSYLLRESKEFGIK